ncbi:MAG: YbgC/FadM family acyl-CoA thioesterase [Thermodesulfovibrionales bacterium]|nr:YbgC/FadM family acyl-CoA thioesterase [Thermodesulfovibrionales bacterium]
MSENIHTIKVTVYYEDTDAGGVVYYANYLRYLERARMEFLKDKGIDVIEFHNKGIFFVVSQLEISYKKPAKLGDSLTVTTEVAEIKNASLKIKNCILKDSELIAEACLTLACVENGKLRRLPEQFRSLLNDKSY